MCGGGGVGVAGWRGTGGGGGGWGEAEKENQGQQQRRTSPVIKGLSTHVPDRLMIKHGRLSTLCPLFAAASKQKPEEPELLMTLNECLCPRDIRRRFIHPTPTTATPPPQAPAFHFLFYTLFFYLFFIVLLTSHKNTHDRTLSSSRILLVLSSKCPTESGTVFRLENNVNSIFRNRKDNSIFCSCVRSVGEWRGLWQFKERGRGREGETKRQRQRQRETRQRQGQRQRDRDRQTDRQTERDGDGERETETDRHTQRQRQRQRQTNVSD